MKVVIVGGVAGGMSAATRLRRLDENAEIVVVEAGPHVSFANCGLPYFVGGVIPNESALLVQTPESLRARFALDVRVNTRATRIDRASKRLTVVNALTGEESAESYDALILAPGAAPRHLDVPGGERALRVRSVPDAKRIADAIAGGSKNVAILGAGFIGVEMAENLRAQGHAVVMAQSGPTILAPFDVEMIEPFQRHLESNGVVIFPSVRATEIGPTTLTLSDGRVLAADVVISAIGVTPDHGLAVDAGLRIGDAGGIWVDEHQRTSDPHIFAVGDAAEKRSAFTGEEQMVWLANLANRHGRLAADVIAGDGDSARPALTTGIVGAFGMVAAITGLSEKVAVRQGIPHDVIHLHPGSHAGYYPGSETVSLKVIFEPDSGRILGAQAVGADGIDKRIDVLATAIYARLTVRDLMNLELAYAPQFGSAKDAVNHAGYVGDNRLSGRTPSVQWHELADRRSAGAVVIDVRTPREYGEQSIPDSVNIPVDELRDRLGEIHASDVIVHCKVGQRGHTATQILRSHGVNASNLDGGFVTWRAGMDSLERTNAISPFTNT